MKQVVSQKILPRKIWHIPSLGDELFHGRIFSLDDPRETYGVFEVRKRRPAIAGNLLVDRANGEDLAVIRKETTPNNKIIFIVEEWKIPNNREMGLAYPRSLLLSQKPKTALKVYEELVASQWWEGPPNFRLDVEEWVSAFKREEEIKNEKVVEAEKARELAIQAFEEAVKKIPKTGDFRRALDELEMKIPSDLREAVILNAKIGDERYLWYKPSSGGDGISQWGKFGPTSGYDGDED